MHELVDGLVAKDPVDGDAPVFPAKEPRLRSDIHGVGRHISGRHISDRLVPGGLIACGRVVEETARRLFEGEALGGAIGHGNIGALAISVPASQPVDRLAHQGDGGEFLPGHRFQHRREMFAEFVCRHMLQLGRAADHHMRHRFQRRLDRGRAGFGGRQKDQTLFPENQHFVRLTGVRAASSLCFLTGPPQPQQAFRSPADPGKPLVNPAGAQWSHKICIEMFAF